MHLFQQRRAWLPLLIVVVGLIGTAVVWQGLRVLQNRALEARFQKDAQQRANRIQQSLDDSVLSSDSLPPLLTARDALTDEEFQLLAQFLRARSKALSNICWAPRIAAEKRAEHEKHWQAAGRDNYHICDLGDGGTGPAPPRNQYFPAVHHFPTALAPFSQGVDMAFHPESSVHLGKALLEEQTTVVFFGQGRCKVFVPVQKSVQDPRQNGQQKETVAMLVCETSIPQALRESMQYFSSDLHMRIEWVGTEGEKKEIGWFPAAKEEHISEAAGMEQEIPLTAGDQSLNLIARPTHAYLQAQSSWGPNFAFLMGLVLTALTALMVGILAGRSIKAEAALEESEAVMRSLVESLPLNLFRKDLSGKFLYVNRRFCETVGHKASELIGNTDFDVFEEPLARKYHEDDQKVIHSGAMLEDVEKHHCDSGPTKYVHVLKSPVFNAEEEVIGVQGMFWDVTDREELEAERRRADMRFRMLVESDVIGVILADLDGRILQANDAFLDMVGYTREDLEANRVRWDEMTPPEHRPLDERAIESLLATGACKAYEKAYFRKDGSRVPVLLGVKMLEAENLCICFVLDVTERHRVLAELKKAKAKADEASQAKSLFLANMSHEVRTPMNAIIGMTELVLSTPLTNEQSEYLSLVLESSESLLSIINDILDFSKVEAGKMQLECIPFALRESIGDTLRSLAFRAHHKGLELACDIPPGTPDFICGDPGRLRQVITNLVGNAIKFTRQGDVILRIDCLNESESTVYLQFSVTDTGVGIAPDRLPHIFEAFEQADNTTTREYGGTGLGLAISSRLVNLMGGNITAKSKVGEGSVFQFAIRFQRASAKDVSPQTRSEGTIAGNRVLVVDDNAANRRILQEMLKNWGMKPEMAPSAAEALDLLTAARRRDEPFELILTDAQMPNMDGFTLVENIRLHPELNGSVILMLTSGDQPGDVTRCEQLKIAAYLMKPVKQSELFDAVTLALGYSKAENETARIPPAIQLGPLDILLVEDSLVNQKLAVGLLTRRGHRVQVAGTGLEALRALGENNFDLILMDVQMPEMDGLEATRLIRAREKNTGTRIPIIAMTAHAMKGDRQRCLAAGMDDYLAKPIRAQQLFEKMAALVGDDSSKNASANHHAASPTEAIFDQEEALRMVGGDVDLLRDVASVYLTEAEQISLQIKRSIEEEDAQTLQRAAHTLKGSSRCLGAQRVALSALRLEQIGQSGDLQEAPAVFAELSARQQELHPQLIAFTATEDKTMSNHSPAEEAPDPGES